MSELQPSEGRTYGGVAATQRLARRRERLLEAGIELFGTVGFAATSVKAICAEAGLSERYFYESFPNRHALLRACFEGVVADAAEAVAAARARPHASAEETIRALLDAFVGAVTADRRRARIQLVETSGLTEELDQLGRSMMRGFAATIVEVAEELVGPQALAREDRDPQLTAMALVGAVNELLIDWELDPGAVSPAQIIEEGTHLYLAALSTFDRG